jgi:hypothetical protein
LDKRTSRFNSVVHPLPRSPREIPETPSGVAGNHAGHEENIMTFAAQIRLARKSD